MLKFFRNKAIDNPWFFRGLMGLLAVTFMISLGWWGNKKEHKENILAEIDQDHISVEEYRRVYKNMARFYRQMLKDQFDEKKFRKQVIDLLVEQKLWLHEASRMGLHVTDAELRESILKLPGFQKDGQFNPDLYQRILAAEHLTPEKFEDQQRDELVVEKAKTLIRQSAALTPAEVSEMELVKPPNISQERENRLAQKREKAIHAYTAALKQRAAIFIKDELL